MSNTPTPLYDVDGNLAGYAETMPAPPLDALGVLATLLAVEGVLETIDAAAVVGRQPGELVAEATAWGAAAALAEAQATPRVVDVEVSPWLAAESAQSVDAADAG